MGNMQPQFPITWDGTGGTSRDTLMALSRPKGGKKILKAPLGLVLPSPRLASSSSSKGPPKLITISKSDLSLRPALIRHSPVRKIFCKSWVCLTLKLLCASDPTAGSNPCTHPHFDLGSQVFPYPATQNSGRAKMMYLPGGNSKPPDCWSVRQRCRRRFDIEQSHARAGLLHVA